MRNTTRIKGLSILVFLLLVCVNVLAVQAVSNDDDVIWPPIPGNMKGNEPIIDVGYIQPISDTPPEITDVGREVDIVNLITQINESMILGFLQNLTSFGPRVTGEPSCVQAGEYLYDAFVEMGLEVRYHNWSYGGYISKNVEATLPGVDPTSDDIYIVCGHYDTVPGSPGADDDGSGVAAVLAAAEIMSHYEFNHTVRFVAFSGEEEGLFGSYMYAQDAYNNGDDIKGVLNADMIGFALNDYQAGYLNIFEDDLSEWLYDFTYHVNQLYDDYIDLQLIHAGWTWGSDHYYFWEYGYSALFYHEYEFNHYYHSPDDTIEHMNLTYDVKGTRLILATLASLAQMNSLNFPPDSPSIHGPHYGKINIDYMFTTDPVTDPEEDSFYCLWDWGDGNMSEWLGPFTSGQTVSAMYSWSTPGVYGIRVKVKDTFGAVSQWSEPFITNMTSKVFLIGLVSDITPNNEATHLTMKRGVLLEFNPFALERYSLVPVIILNNETRGYLGSRVMIGGFYAVLLLDQPVSSHPFQVHIKKGRF